MPTQSPHRDPAAVLWRYPLAVIGFVVSAGTGCGYFIGGGVEYELRIGTAIIDAVADLGAVAAGTTVDDNGLSPAVLLCQGEDGITYFNDELLSDDGRPVEGDVVVRGGWGVSGELTDASCPETRLGAEARRVETESFVCQASLEDGFDPKIGRAHV